MDVLHCGVEWGIASMAATVSRRGSGADHLGTRRRARVGDGAGWEITDLLGWFAQDFGLAAWVNRLRLAMGSAPALSPGSSRNRKLTQEIDYLRPPRSC